MVFDGTGPAPVLTTAAGEGGTTLLADGVPVALVEGAEALDLAAVRLLAA